MSEWTSIGHCHLRLLTEEELEHWRKGADESSWDDDDMPLPEPGWWQMSFEPDFRRSREKERIAAGLFGHAGDWWDLSIPYADERKVGDLRLEPDRNDFIVYGPRDDLEKYAEILNAFIDDDAFFADAIARHQEKERESERRAAERKAKEAAQTPEAPAPRQDHSSPPKSRGIFARLFGRK